MTAVRVCVVNDVVQLPTNEFLGLVAKHCCPGRIQVGAAEIWPHYIKTITDGFKDGPQVLSAFLKILLDLLAVGDIKQVSRISEKLAFGGEARAACIDDPPVHAIGPPQPILDGESFIPLVCKKEMFACCLPILRMHSIEPPETQAFVLALAGELVPPVREERAETVWLRHPEHGRSGVGKTMKSLFALLEGLLGPAVLRTDSHLVGSKLQQQPVFLRWKVCALGTSD